MTADSAQEDEAETDNEGDGHEFASGWKARRQRRMSGAVTWILFGMLIILIPFSVWAAFRFEPFGLLPPIEQSLIVTLVPIGSAVVGCVIVVAGLLWYEVERSRYREQIDREKQGWGRD